MEKLNLRPESRRVDTGDSDMTYHSLYQNDDAKKNLINPNSTKASHSPGEQPKAVLEKRISWFQPLLHLLPVAVTVGIVQLSIRNIYWADSAHYYDDLQTILQFPAKIHEILIIGSLSAIVIHIFRRMLVGPDGMPLGLMVGAFQIGSAEYLFSKSYWKPLKHSFLSLQQKQFKTFFVALALGCAIIYSFLVGPASAGALLPNLRWWHMRNPFDGRKLESYISKTPSELYSMELKVDSIHEACLSDPFWNSGYCPGGGYSTLNEWAWTRQQEGSWYNVTDSQHYNPTMLSSFSGQAQRDIIVGLMSSKDSTNNAAISATLHASILALTDAFWHYINVNPVGKINKVQQPKFIIPKGGNVSIPLVQVQCSAYDLAETLHRGEILEFDTDAIVSGFSGSGLDIYSVGKWPVPDEAWNYFRPPPWNTTNVTWVETSEVKRPQGKTLPSSLAAVVSVPMVRPYRGSNGTDWHEQGSIVNPCVIDARWATTDMSFDITDPVVKTSLTDWLGKTNLTDSKLDVRASMSKWEISEPISISLDWVRAIDDLIGSGVMQTVLEQFVFPFSYEEPELLEFVPTSSANEDWKKQHADGIAIILSTVVADWISRTALFDANFTTVLSPAQGGFVHAIDLLNQKTAAGLADKPISSFENQIKIVYTVDRYGWGYGLGTKTIWFSIITLLIHSALVFVYFFYAFIFWCYSHGWTSKAWGSIGEVLALAITSPPADELQNTGGGIDKPGTWMTTLRIREAGSDPNKIELVVGTRSGVELPGENKLQIRKRYS